MPEERASQRKWQNWTVAISGMNCAPESPGPGLAVARSIREHSEFKGRIVALGYDVLDAGLYASGISDSGYLVPYPSCGKESLFERLKQIHELEGIDVIIPCLDAEIQNYISIKDELAELGIKMLLPSMEQFKARTKDQLERLCQEAGVLTPRTKVISNPAFFDECEAQGFEYPLMVKGIFYDATMARNSQEAKAIMHKLVSSWGYPVLVQEIVWGDEFDLSAIGDGKCSMIAEVMMRKRGISEKGKAWAGVTVEEPAVSAAAARLIYKLAWRGPFEVEVMRAHNGDVYLIEINPRFPAWIYLSSAVGRNLPINLLKALAQDESYDLGPPKTGTFFIRHAQELIVELPQFESMMINGGAQASGLNASLPDARDANAAPMQNTVDSDMNGILTGI